MLTNGTNVPRFLYGTAWKESETARLTELALRHGFRGIDTANQRKHYFEEAVGQGILNAIRAGLVTRDDLFLQTKYTFRRGQDHRLPYDADAPIANQVQQSFALSLKRLQTDHIESYVLHGPTNNVGLVADDWEAWRAMEDIAKSGQVRMLGISNISAEQLQLLCREAHIRPHVVQNRCYATRDWDREVREYCSAHKIVYQGFSLLTANPAVSAHPELARVSKHYDRTISQIIFRFALDIGITPLTGTKHAEHMTADLAVLDFQLDPKDVTRIEALSIV
jgi:diketogulonate reductase-like aldo/keto reductase